MRTEGDTVGRNGRVDRGRERKVGAWLAGITGGYLLLCFIVPAYLPAGTIPELSGRANTLDYMTADGWGNLEHPEDGAMGHNQSAHGGPVAWSDLDPLAAFVYAFGDFNCHQKHERSWVINENQMPVCTRDIGIFAGLAIAGLLFSRRGWNRWTVRDTFLTLLPDDWMGTAYARDQRLWWMLGLCVLLGVPMVMDGGIQAISAYESTNPVRLATGAPFGFVIGWFFASSLAARPRLFEDGPGQVILPAGARLVSQVVELAEDVVEDVVEGLEDAIEAVGEALGVDDEE